MLGAIAGDIAGSAHEHHRVETRDFPLFTRASRFTDDTVLTVATAHAILTDGDYAAGYHVFGNRHPHAGYGGKFRAWLRTSAPRPYGSWGNGSAMRVSPVGWAFDTEQDVLHEAERSAAVTPTLRPPSRDRSPKPGTAACRPNCATERAPRSATTCSM